jgi:hypothetical protein
MHTRTHDQATHMHVRVVEFGKIEQAQGPEPCYVFFEGKPIYIVEIAHQ